MAFPRGIVIVLLCAMGFALAGGLLGLTLGVGIPFYYRGVFAGGSDPGFDPVQVGLGLGLSQGAICGVIVGSVVVLMKVLSGSPSLEGKADDSTTGRGDSGRADPSLIRRVLLLLAFVIAIGCGGVVGFVYGAVIVQMEQYRANAQRKLARIRPILRHPDFAKVIALESSDGEVYLSGSVGSEQSRKALEEQIRSLFGDEEARRLAGLVELDRK